MRSVAVAPQVLMLGSRGRVTSMFRNKFISFDLIAVVMSANICMVVACGVLASSVVYAQQDDSNDPVVIYSTRNEISVVSLDGTNRRRLLELGDDASCGSPRVSPNGELLAYFTYREEGGGRWDCFVADIGAGTFRKLYESHNGLFLDWFSDQTLALSTWEALYLLDIQSLQAKEIARDVQLMHCIPDSSLMLVEIDRNLALMESDGSVADVLDNEHSYTYAAISPDLTRLVLMYPNGTIDLVGAANLTASMNTNTMSYSSRDWNCIEKGSTSAAGVGYYAHSVTWSPEGRYIAIGQIVRRFDEASRKRSSKAFLAIFDVEECEQVAGYSSGASRSELQAFSVDCNGTDWIGEMPASSR